MTARASLVAALLVVAGSTLAVAGVHPVAAQPAPGSDPPEETEDGATFTVSTQSIELHEDGKICAEKMAPDVNKLTITDATMNGVELYLGNEDEPKKVTAESAGVDEIVLYTNGENEMVNLLALTGACIPLDQDQETVIEVYYQEAGTLEMADFEMVTGGTDPPPEPGGLTLPDSILNESSEEDDESVDEVSDTVDRTTAVVGNATDPVDETTDTVDETTENVTETVDRVENPTETVDETNDTVDETVDETNDTVDETVDETNDTVDRTTETVDDATDEVEDTTTEVGDTVDDTTDTVNDTADSITDPPESPGDTVDDTTTEVRDTADETEDDAEDTAGSATDTVDDTTTEVHETAEEVVPPTVGFGIGENVPLVGDPVTLDASGSSDSDGSIQKYEWDLDGDGDYEKTGQRVTHAFSEPGEHQVTLRVTDDDGATDTATKTVRVNAPPNAAFDVVSDLLAVGEPIDLDATRSSDSDGSIQKYEWDLDGDGNYEQTGPTPSPTFSDVGEHEITLRVTDDDGATDTATRTIEVTDDGGLLGGDDTTTDGDSTSTDSDDGDDTSIIGVILP